MLRLGNVMGSPYVGVYCCANENFAIVPDTAEDSIVKSIGEALQVEVIRSYIAGSTVVGSLVAMNSNGIVLTNFAEKQEIAKLPEGLNVGIMEEKLNAAGNNILVNDGGAYVHPHASRKCVQMLEEVFGVDVRRSAIAGIETVGSVAIATSKGIVCHPRTSDEELREISSFFGAQAAVATLNYGTPYLGACAVANSKGALVGSLTTPIELGRLEDGLGLF